MKIQTTVIHVDTHGHTDILDITPPIQNALTGTGLREGIVTVFIPGSTAGVTTIEFEPGVIADFRKAIERLAPSDIEYEHNQRWGDGNGFAHVRAALIGPSVTVPFAAGKLSLGMWQQIVLLDFDNRGRRRDIILKFLGE